jgi:hypothetical protein
MFCYQPWLPPEVYQKLPQSISAEGIVPSLRRHQRTSTGGLGTSLMFVMSWCHVARSLAPLSLPPSLPPSLPLSESSEISNTLDAPIPKLPTPLACLARAEKTAHGPTQEARVPFFKRSGRFRRVCKARHAAANARRCFFFRVVAYF